MRKKICRIEAAGVVRFILVIGCLVSFLYLAASAERYQAARNEYRQLAGDFCNSLEGKELCRSNEDLSDLSDLSDQDDPAVVLRRRNPDYAFWLTIPGTHVNYPVVKSVKEGYYLNHTFEGEENPGGCLFVPADEEPLTSDNTIVYGHNMKDGSMFADLKRYIRKEYYEKYPDLWIYGEGGWNHYEIFACMIRPEEDDTVYRSCFFDCDEKREYLKAVCDASIYETDIRPDCGDQLLTLSTCYGSGKRVIVQAVLLCYTE